MRRTTAAFTTAIATLAVAAPPRAIAQDDSLGLTLLAQNFAIAPNGMVRLEYELAGTIPDTIPDTAPPATTSTAPATVAVPTPVSDPAASDTTASTNTATTAAQPGDTTTATTLPAAGSALTVLVTALDPITLRSEVAAVLDGDARSAIDSAEYDLADVLGPDELSTDQNGTTSGRRSLILDVQTSTGGEVRSELALPRGGLYPVTVEIRQGGRRLTRHVTFIERLATPDSGALPRSTLNLSIVAAIPDPGPEPDTLDVVELHARITELAQLGELIAAPLTVSVPPIVAATLDDDPQLAARLRTALSGDEVLALPESMLDPSSAVASDQVEAFTRELREGEDALRRALPSTAIRRVAWLTDAPLSAGGASMLRDLGVQLVVVPFDLYLAFESNQTAHIRTDLTDPTLLVAGELSGGGELAISVIDPINELFATDRDVEGTPTEVAVHLFAELMATRVQLGPSARSFMLATPDLGIPDPDVLAVIEGFVDEHPDVAFQTLSFVPGSTSPFLINGERVRVTFPPTAGPDLTNRVHEIDLVALHLAHTASMLPADDPRPERWRTELSGLISTGIDDATATRRLDRIERDLQRIEEAIQLPAPSTFTLAGEAGTITLRIGNTSTTDLRVGVRVSGPSRLAFPEPDTEWLLTAAAITDVTIPIEARSNGTSDVVVEVHTPSGEVIGEPIVLKARVNALSGLGQLLTGAALLVLATWWFSHFRRKRRQRHLAPSRTGHPSNGAHESPGPIAAPASSSPDRSSSNGDDVSPDAAVASLEQPEG